MPHFLRPWLILAGLWALILALPFLRGQALSDWGEILFGLAPRLENGSANWNNDIGIGADFGNGGDAPELISFAGLKVEARAVDALKRFPNDCKIWLDAALGPLFTSEKTKASNLEILNSKFPNDAVILAALLAGNSENMTTRHPGPSSNPNINWSVQITNPYPISSPYNSLGSRFWTPPERKKWDKWRAWAKIGQRLEPNNAFWWWMETQFALGGRYDDEVWVILRAGSQKTNYDDHSTTAMLWRLEARKKRFGTLSALEVQAIWSGFSTNHLGKMRESTRQVCDNVKGLRLLGRHKTAVEGARDLMRMARLTRLHSKTLIGSLVGLACENLTMNNVGIVGATTLVRPKAGSSVAVFSAFPKSLSYYAATIGRRDIARECNIEWGVLARWRARRWPVETFNNGASPADGYGGPLSGVFAFQLLKTLPGAAIIGLVLWIFDRKRLCARLGVAEAPPLTGFWVSGALCSLFWIMTWFVITAIGFVFSNLNAAAATPPAPNWGFWPFLQTASEIWPDLPLWMGWSSTLGAVVFALWIATTKQRENAGKLSLRARLKRLFVAPEHGLTRFDFAPLLVLCVTVAFWCAALVAFVWFFWWTFSDLNYQSDQGLAETVEYEAVFTCAFFAFLLAPRFGVWLSLPAKRATLLGWSRLTRRFLLAHALTATSLYLLLNLWSWRAGVNVEAGLRSVWTLGETQMMAKQIGL